MTKTKHTIVVALIAAAFTTGAFAGPASKNVLKPSVTESKSDLTGSLETSVVSNYTYHGQVLDSNPVFVPKLSLQYPLFEGGSLQFSAEQIVGTSGSTWYRSKYNLGLAVNLGRISVTPGFEVKAYPERDRSNSQGITGKLAFNDAGLLPVTLNPYVYTSHAVDPKGGYYYEVGVAPGKNLGKLDVSFPVTVGASSRNYYAQSDENVSYAFTSAGISTTYHVTDRLALKAAAAYYNTDAALSNSSKSFIQSQASVSVSF